jgi:hypothetical protein
LKNEADLVLPHLRQAVVVQLAQHLLSMRISPAGGRSSPDQVEQCRLAGARRSDDADHLALADGEIDRMKRGNLSFAVEGFANLPEMDIQCLMMTKGMAR